MTPEEQEEDRLLHCRLHAQEQSLLSILLGIPVGMAAVLIFGIALSLVCALIQWLVNLVV